MITVTTLLLVLVVLTWFFLNCLIPGEMTSICSVSIDLSLSGNVPTPSSDSEMALSC